MLRARPRRLALVEQLACVCDGLLARGQLARVLRLGERVEQLADLRSGGDAQLGGELVPAQQRRCGAVGVPAKGVAEDPTRDAEVGLDRLLRTRATRGEPVGD